MTVPYLMLRPRTYMYSSSPFIKPTLFRRAERLQRPLANLHCGSQWACPSHRQHNIPCRRCSSNCQDNSACNVLIAGGIVIFAAARSLRTMSAGLSRLSHAMCRQCAHPVPNGHRLWYSGRDTTVCVVVKKRKRCKSRNGRSSQFVRQGGDHDLFVRALRGFPVHATYSTVVF